MAKNDKDKSAPGAFETGDVRAALVYTTFPDQAAAAAIGRDLVRTGLAACVNIVPGMLSIYQWQGQLEEAAEVVMLIKTRASLTDAVTTFIGARHAYDVPAILVLDVAGGAPAYRDWIFAQTTPPVEPAP
jgi:periplasmic divalent cation tolerance protein